MKTNLLLMAWAGLALGGPPASQPTNIQELYLTVRDYLSGRIDSAGFFPYQKPCLVQDQKIVHLDTAYFFSTGPLTAILPLTIGNLENAFSSMTRFRYWLESNFRSDRELAEVDAYLKKYKIKYFYFGSLRK